jgi:putative ABC transport system permease protein
MLIAGFGGALGLALVFPVAGSFAQMFPTFFPVFNVEPVTIAICVGVALLAGLAAAAYPVLRALHTSIADGLRSIG